MPIRPPAGSRLLHQLGDFTAHAAAGLLAAAAVLAWAAVGVVLGFPNWWDNVLYIVSSSARQLVSSSARR